MSVVAPAKQINDNGREECRESSGNNLKTARHDLKALGRERKCAAEKAVIARILRETHYNRKATAQRLQISYKALFYKIHQYGLVWKAEVDEQDNLRRMNVLGTRANQINSYSPFLGADVSALVESW